MTVKQFRCVTNSLAIRTQPSLGDAYKTDHALKMNDVISVDDSTRVESAGYMWLKHSLGWPAERTDKLIAINVQKFRDFHRVSLAHAA